MDKTSVSGTKLHRMVHGATEPLPQANGKQNQSDAALGRLEILEDNRGGMVSQAYCLQLRSQKTPEFIDITERVRECVSLAGIRYGFVVVYSKHTTAAIKINENEPLLLQDMEQFLERISPRDAPYRHNDFTIRTVNMTDDECPNGHAHCQQLFLGTSETIPVLDGTMQFGRWQSIFMIELDHPRPREIVVQVVGSG